MRCTPVASDGILTTLRVARRLQALSVPMLYWSMRRWNTHHELHACTLARCLQAALTRCLQARQDALDSECDSCVYILLLPALRPKLLPPPACSARTPHAPHAGSPQSPARPIRGRPGPQSIRVRPGPAGRSARPGPAQAFKCQLL